MIPQLEWIQSRAHKARFPLAILISGSTFLYHFVLSSSSMSEMFFDRPTNSDETIDHVKYIVIASKTVLGHRESRIIPNYSKCKNYSIWLQQCI